MTISKISEQEIKDIEAPPAAADSGMEIGAELSKEEKESTATGSGTPKWDRTILNLFKAYIVMLIIIVVGPFAIYATVPDSDDPDYSASSTDFQQRIGTIVLIYTVGIGILIVTLVSLVHTILRWTQLSTRSKLVGLFPVFASCGLFYVVQTIVSSATN